jgi:23S rRNA (adenine2503-C2)-methyltransferase
VAVTSSPPSLCSLAPAELGGWLAEHGQPEYRVGQLLAWLARGATTFDEMHDLPGGLRRELSAAFRVTSLTEKVRSEADDGLTTKLLYELDGGHTVESVIMRYGSRSTLCISSQVGCPIGCPFCATGQGRFGRNLAAHEIVEQALDANRRLQAESRRLSNVVFMGMGEPMANYTAVVESIRRLADPKLLEISPRRVVVSTSGLVPPMERLALEALPVTLAVSLHAARDDLRDVLVPVNRRYPLAEVIGAARAYGEKTGRRVSYEWVLLAGVNDTARDAEELGKLLDRRLSHVNLIPFNPVSGTPYRAPEPADIQRFLGQVRAQGLNVTLRDTRGREADAACGQLRARTLEMEAASR